ncbi:type II secretion system protein [bacterium]|nr:type II secretion system protein [bacterium]
MTKRHGFTLAEVLITLGIIGVVAAMTIPTLIANTNSAKFRSQYKKALSTLNQAALMGQAQYDVNYSDATSKCSDEMGEAKRTHWGQTADSDPTLCAIFHDVLSGATYEEDVSDLTNTKGDYRITIATNTGIVTTKAGTAMAANGAPTGHAISLADGSMFVFPDDSVSCTRTSPCYGYIDVNGTTLPNREVSCSDDDAQAANCTVPNDAAHMSDIYPVIFFDSTVEPATAAARYVLTTSK